jgi:hypothetical protein
MIQQLKANSLVSPGYSWHNDELRYKSHLYLRKHSQIKSMVLYELHATPTTGHSRFTKTYDWIKRSFFWDGMKKDVRSFVAECDVCQHNKGKTIKHPGTLQPLLIPPAIWRDISMDFIAGLPKSGNNYVIMVVVDRIPSMLIYVLFNTHLPHQLWLNFSWIISSSFMACIILFFFIKIQLSPEIFGKNYSDSRAPNCISAPPIIPRLMVKLKSSISVWRLI